MPRNVAPANRRNQAPQTRASDHRDLARLREVAAQRDARFGREFDEHPAPVMRIRDVFEDTYNYMKSGTLLRQVVNKINEIDFNNSDDRHTFGAIYEQILRDLQSAGNAGEFYTPRAVTKFIIDRLSPTLDEVVLDPACGIGGFLTCAIDHKRKAVHFPADEDVLRGTIRGVEKKSLPHMLCITNMILHGIDTPSGIRHGNTLANAYRDYGDKDRVPVTIQNRQLEVRPFDRSNS